MATVQQLAETVRTGVTLMAVALAAAILAITLFHENLLADAAVDLRPATLDCSIAVADVPSGCRAR